MTSSGVGSCSEPGVGGIEAEKPCTVCDQAATASTTACWLSRTASRNCSWLFWVTSVMLDIVYLLNWV
jgi:hypothetical protein